MTEQVDRAEAYRLIARGFAILADVEERRDVSQGASDDLLTIQSCGLEARTVRRLIDAGHLPAVRLGRTIRFRKSDLLALVDRPGLKCKPRLPHDADEGEKKAEADVARTYAALVERARHPSPRQVAALKREERKRQTRP